jgi:ketosteroid isomerase-like protein
MTAGKESAGALAERYLLAVAAQDWATVEACVAADVARLGPYGDDFEDRGPYLAFLQRTMPALEGYRLDIDTVTEAGDGRVFVELREAVDVHGVPLLTHECLVLDVVEDRVARVAIYIRQDGGQGHGAGDGGVP